MLTSSLVSGLIYALTGACSGLLAGLFGVGGGIILVPALLYLFDYMQTVPASMQMQVAAGTSLADK